MARCLIIGCGCRGRALGTELRARGHAVRGTTRSAAVAAQIEAVGIEPYVGDPDRVATIAPALEHAGVACLLLGSVCGEPEAVRALHGTRLEMLLSRMLDSTVRGVIYEATGTVPAEVLHRGTTIVRATCEDSRIPFALLLAPPQEHARWLQGALSAVREVLLPPGGRSATA